MLKNIWNFRKSITFPFVMACFLVLLSGHWAFALEKTLTNSIGMTFVLIPEGNLIMGSPISEPNRKANEVQHEVAISKPFYMQTTEVTVEQWREIMGKPFFGRKKGTKDMPVVQVSWKDCQDFIKKLNEQNDGVYRLPTEAEWEYACRAGTQTAYGIGENIDCTKAMYSNNTLKHPECVDAVKDEGLKADQPAPVGHYTPNNWGLYDMNGNVWEWCQDWYRPYRAKGDPKSKIPVIEEETRKVRRGGSWYGIRSRCRCANRNFSHFANRYQTTGFRLVREVK